MLIATGNLFLYDFDGALLWEADLGPLDSGASYDDTYQWGAASSPIIWENLVIVQADQQEGSFIAAFDVASGEEVWRTERDLISAFSTPTVHAGPERTELITNGAGTMFGYDPVTGAELWRMSGSSNNTTPTPVVDGGAHLPDERLPDPPDLRHPDGRHRRHLARGGDALQRPRRLEFAP